MKKNLSKSLYPGLTKSQHKENNEYFEKLFNLVNDGGYVPLMEIGVLLQKTPTGWIRIPKPTT